LAFSQKQVASRTLWQLWDNGDGGKNTDERLLIKYSLRIPIRLVAVWDTVGALGMPFGNIPGVSRSSFGWLHTGLRVPIENAFHAKAIDEHRRAFAPTLWTVRKPKDRNRHELPRTQ
jgi:hypothetical protein